jgi:hypothetical protein
MSSLGKFAFSFQPSHAFCLNKIEKLTVNINPPLALSGYGGKKKDHSDPSAGCNFVKNTES